MKRWLYALLALFTAWSMAGCAAAVTAEPTPSPLPPTATLTALPTATFTPVPPTETATPTLTDTPQPSATPEPSDTPKPTDTPTATVDPCRSLPGVQRRDPVRLTVVNKTGQGISLKLEECGTSVLSIQVFLTAGTAEEPVTSVFSVNPGGYRQKIQKCGEETEQVSGLALTGNMRLEFAPCATPTPAP